MHTQDLKKRLLQAFNKRYNRNIQVEDVDFVGAAVWLEAGCNSKVTIKAKASSDLFTGQFEIMYNRYRLDESLNGLRLSGGPGTYKTTQDVLKFLREKCGVSAYDEDFGNVPISPTATSITLTPKTDATAWLPPYGYTLQLNN